MNAASHETAVWLLPEELESTKVGTDDATPGVAETMCADRGDLNELVGSKDPKKVDVVVKSVPGTAWRACRTWAIVAERCHRVVKCAWGRREELAIAPTLYTCIQRGAQRDLITVTFARVRLCEL